MAEERRQVNIFVGLGGTGSAIVSNLFKRFSPDLPVRFLIYDSDLQKKPESFPDINFCPAVRERTDAINFCRSCLENKKKPNLAKSFRQYWPGMYIGLQDKCDRLQNFEGVGLGQSRVKGFLGFLKHYHDGCTIVQRIIAEARATCGTNRLDVISGLNIRLICSFAGGTGSGTFLDLAYLLKCKIPNCKIYGYFIFAGAAMMARTKIDSHDYLRTYANTYGAWWELKYWMSLPSKKYQKVYDEGVGHSVSQKEAPFNVLYLFDYKNSVDKNLNHWTEYETLVADCIYDTLMRRQVTTNILTVLDNNERDVNSMGRAILLYPRKDILDLLGLYFLRDIIETQMIPENTQNIREALETDIGDLGFDEKRDQIKTGLKKYRFGKMNFPTFPPIKDSLVRIMNKDNFQRILIEVDERFKKTVHEANEFLGNIFPEYLKEKQEKFLQIFKENVTPKGISFAHGYLEYFLGYIERCVQKLKEDASPDSKLNRVDNDLELQLILVNSRSGSNRNENNKLASLYETYFTAQCDVLIRNKKIELYEKFSTFVKQIKSAIDFVQDYIKKDKILGNIRGKIYALEQEIESSYPNYASMIKVMDIGKSLDYYRNKYTEFKESIGTRLDSAYREFEGRIADFTTNEVLTQILKTGHLDDLTKKKFQNDLGKIVFNAFATAFSDEIPKNIFEALYHESINKNEQNYENYFQGVINLLKEEASAVFLRAKESSNMANNHFVALNLSLFKDTVADLIKRFNVKINQRNILSGINPIDTNDEEMSDQIICITLKSGFNLDDIEGFGPDGEYYNAYVAISNATELKYRYEVFIDARYTPRGLPARLLFLVAEHFKVIIKQIDKDGNETGVYKLGTQTLKKNLRGREANILWFVNNEDPQKRNDILKELKEKWKEIPANKRQEEFEKIRTELKNCGDNTTDENLRKIYEQDTKVLEEAIAAGYYDNDDITTIV